MRPSGWGIITKSIDDGIPNLVGVLTDLTIVHPSGCEDTIPDWLKGEITLERLVEEMKALKGEKPTGTDAEACAYPLTASLVFPFAGGYSVNALKAIARVITTPREQGRMFQVSDKGDRLIQIATELEEIEYN